MIKAVCFNRKAFSADAVQRICRETGGRYHGSLIDPSMANCIESTADGGVFFSVTGRVPKGTLDCKGDIERFIYVNRNFGRQPAQ